VYQPISASFWRLYLSYVLPLGSLSLLKRKLKSDAAQVDIRDHGKKSMRFFASKLRIGPNVV